VQKNVQETWQTDARDCPSADANSELHIGDLAISRLCQQCVADPRQSILNWLQTILDFVNMSDALEHLTCTLVRFDDQQYPSGSAMIHSWWTVVTDLFRGLGQRSVSRVTEDSVENLSVEYQNQVAVR